MGEHPDDPVGPTGALTRLFVAADRLGIDAAPLQQRVPQVVPALTRGAWASVDTDDRLALRCLQSESGPGLPLARPAETRCFELEQEPDGSVTEIVTAIGRRPFTDDRAFLLDAGIPEPVTKQLGDLVDLLGDGTCDGLARRQALDGETWFASVSYAAMDVGQPALEVRELTKARVISLARSIGVHPAQVTLLEHLHWFAHHGFSVSFQFGKRGILPILLVDYENIPWISVTKLAQQLRPVPAQGPRLGTFAGAFAAPEATSLQLAFGPPDGPNRVARMRVSVDAT